MQVDRVEAAYASVFAIELIQILVYRREIFIITARQIKRPLPNLILRIVSECSIRAVQLKITGAPGLALQTSENRHARRQCRGPADKHQQKRGDNNATAQ